jgi:predicted ATPase
VPSLLCVLAEAALAAGRPEEARSALGEAAGLVDSNGNMLYAAEGLRLEGELALVERGDAAGRRAAEQKFLGALTLARSQGARALELRAATRLARLWAEEGDSPRAAELLAPLHAGFDAELETADLRTARTVLAALTGADSRIGS